MYSFTSERMRRLEWSTLGAYLRTAEPLGEEPRSLKQKRSGGRTRPARLWCGRRCPRAQPASCSTRPSPPSPAPAQPESRAALACHAEAARCLELQPAPRRVLAARAARHARLWLPPTASAYRSIGLQRGAAVVHNDVQDGPNLLPAMGRLGPLGPTWALGGEKRRMPARACCRLGAAAPYTPSC